MQFGLYSFGDLTPDPHSGRAQSAGERLADVLAAAKLADAAGFDAFALGEHHRLDFAISATPVALAALAVTTRRLQLASAVTILSTADPVRVFEDFATVDLLSGGRVEIIAGRGVFTESFPLFGYDLARQDEIFAEHLDLLLQLNAAPRASFRGKFRAPLDNAEISPRPEKPLSIWVGTGGTVASAERAGRLGLPLSMANIGLPPAELAPAIAAYRAAADAAGHDGAALPVSLAAHLHVARDSQEARRRFYPHYAAYFEGHTPFPGRARKVSPEDFAARAAPTGALFCGSPQEIIDKVGYERGLFGHTRFLGQLDLGGQSQAAVAEMIELLASDVLPALRRMD